MIYIVGIGPGERAQMTQNAINAIESADVIAGYSVYIDLIKDFCKDKKIVNTAMMKEVDRCEKAALYAKEGHTVAVVSSGDAGIYGMASLMFEVCEQLNVDVPIEVVAGITAANSAAAVLGAPLSHDFATISLSNLLTPWENIEKRLYHASKAGFIIAIYNPSSKKRHDFLQKACGILMQNLSPETMCGYVKNIGRDGQENKILTLKELQNEAVDMFTTIIIGNETTKVINKRLVTPRGYRFE